MYRRGLACVFVIFSLNLVFTSGKMKNKYSKEVNDVKEYEGNPFKMMKVNLLWKKASKVSYREDRLCRSSYRIHIGTTAVCECRV